MIDPVEYGREVRASRERIKGRMQEAAEAVHADCRQREAALQAEVERLRAGLTVIKDADDFAGTDMKAYAAGVLSMAEALTEATQAAGPKDDRCHHISEGGVPAEMCDDCQRDMQATQAAGSES